MRDVARLTGLPPSTIHFYIRTRLLPQPEKTGPNQAVYGPEFVERVQLIKLLQQQANLPLADIRDALEKVSDESLRNVSERIVVVARNAVEAMRDAAGDGSADAVSVAELASRGVRPTDVDMMVRAELITPVDEGDRSMLTPFDSQIAIAFANLREILGEQIQPMMPILALFATHLRTMSSVEAAQAARVILVSGSDGSKVRAADHDAVRSVAWARDDFISAIHRKELAVALGKLIGRPGTATLDAVSEQVP